MCITFTQYNKHQERKKNGEHAIIIIVVLYSMVNSDMHKAENNQNDRESGPAVVCRSSWDQSV